MPPPGSRRQLLLFLAAVLLPSVVLVGLGVRTIAQERELADNRRAEERQRLILDISRHLLVRLERITLDEIGTWGREETQARPLRPKNPLVALVGTVAEDRIVLPWERHDDGWMPLHDAAFARQVQDAEYLEFAAHRPDQAAARYEAILTDAPQPAQRDYARLLLARARTQQGRTADATRHYRILLALPADVTDEAGIPLAYYAAGRLLEDPASRGDVIARLHAEWTTPQWIPPAAAYMLAALSETLADTLRSDALRDAAESVRRQARSYVARLNQALALQRDLLPLLQRGRMSRTTESESPATPRWLAYGDDLWLVGLSPTLTEGHALILAVRAADLFDVVLREDVGTASFPGVPVLSTDGTGESLGPSFPDLRVVFQPGEDPLPDAPWTTRRAFYFGALLLVLSVTLFGAYLHWRDVRREMRLAALRAQFVSSVTHELKTPLTAIRMFAETLKLGRARDPETRHLYLDTIVHESERLTRLINNVLDFSQIEQGRKLYHPAPAALPDVVHAAATAMAYPLHQQGFSFHVDVDETLPAVHVDRDAIEQAVLNLLANAVKYSGDARTVELRLYRADGEARIDVIDHGIGIAPAEQARIFDRFYRAATPENDRISGAGLGLALVAHIMDAHRGRATVRSAPGQGSTFTLHLPLNGVP